MDLLHLLDERTLSELDHVRLSTLMRRTPAAAGGLLERLLDGASTVLPEDVPADLVTMHSRLRLVDPATGERSELTLAYPAEADPASHQLSVLSPVGTALLGCRVGDTASWATPDGQAHACVVEAILYQPEAAGDYTG
jgi:regulator of nucleoside diphosphate kinase